MIRKYHNHKLPTNLWHREEEPHNNQSHSGIIFKQAGLIPEGLFMVGTKSQRLVPSSASHEWGGMRGGRTQLALEGVLVDLP